MTLDEYFLRRQAIDINTAKRKYQSVVDAFDARIINLFDDKGKFVVNKYEDIYNVEQAINDILGTNSEKTKKQKVDFKLLSNVAKKVRKEVKEHGN